VAEVAVVAEIHPLKR